MPFCNSDETDYSEEKKIDNPISSPAMSCDDGADNPHESHSVESDCHDTSLQQPNEQEEHFPKQQTPYIKNEYDPSPTKSSWTTHNNGASRSLHNTNTPCRSTLFSSRRSSLDDRSDSNLRTKSWTDQRAPEPFSSPYKSNHNTNKESHTPNNNTKTSKKYGYGDLFRSSSSGVSNTNAGGISVGSSTGMRSRSYHGGKRTMFANRETNVGTRSTYFNNLRAKSESSRISSAIERQPSFTNNDFPSLTPQQPTKQQLELNSQEVRQTSWSAVVGKSEKDVTTKTDGSTSCQNDITVGIPHLPLYGMPTTKESITDIDVDEQVESSSDEEGERTKVLVVEEQSSPISPTRTYWQQIQRQRAHSFHHFSSSSDHHPPIHSFSPPTPTANNEIHPFSSFTTMSISALQNDIGTLLARSNRVDEAIKRYKLSIDSARSTLNGLQNEEENISKDEDFISNKKAPRGKCPKVTEAEGLAWFRQKLLRGDMIPALPADMSQDGDDNNMTQEGSSPNSSSMLPLPPPPFQPAGFGGCALASPRRLRSASFSVADLCPQHLSMPRIEQTQSIDQAPRSPLRPSKKLSRNYATSACPVTAPHPGKPMLQSFQPHSTPQLSRSHSRSSSFHHRNHNPQTTHHSIVPSDDIVHDIHQHQKLDCPDEVYSCNGLTPLGLEYICDPLPILGSALRSMLSWQASGVGGTKKENSTMIEVVTLIAARLNLASLEYRKASGGASDQLQQVLDILELALEDFHNVNDCRTGKKFSTLFSLLKAVVHCNIGTVKYRLNKVRDSKASFEEAKSALEHDEREHGNRHVVFDLDSSAESGNYNQSSAEPHDDNRFPPQSYLLLVIRLNLSRVSLRLSKPDEAKEFCNLIAEDNKPHRRNSSRRSLMGSSGPSFRRSNSFSAASSSLETAMAAYEHDIDRRSKWMANVAEHYITGLIHEASGEGSDYKEAWHHYNRLLSLARVKLDHRHVYICTLLERRGAVLFEQRNLGGSMLSYLACLKILEHQQSTGSIVFNEADLSRVLYAIARVLHDNEEYHDAINMYQKALVYQRALASVSGRPTLDVITTLCNICRVHHLAGEFDAALAANREVLDLALILVGGKMEHPFLINRLKIEGK